MSDSDELDDDQLLAVLREAVEARATPGPAMVEMIMAGYDITNIDGRLAELVEDVPIGAVAGVRAGDGQPRLVTCATDGLMFEFEIRPTSPQVVGHLEPATAGVVHLEQIGVEPSVEVEVDGMADFEFRLRATGPFRLRFASPSGPSIFTDWLLP